MVITIVTAIVCVQLSRHERESMLSAKEKVAATVAHLFVAGLVAPLTFGDDKGAQEQTSLLIATDDVMYGAVWATQAEEGKPLRKVGEIRPRELAVEPPVPHRDTRVQRAPELVFAESPVVDATGNVVGMAQLAFSLEKENAAISALERRTLFGAAALALGVSVLLLGLTRTFIIRRLARLADAARRFENGEPVDIDTAGRDEVSTLAGAFAAMTASIATREQRISDRNRDLRRVLDNVAEGFLAVDPAGVMSEERSRVIDEWFGAPPSSVFVQYMEAVAPAVAPWIRLGWASLADDVMPVEVVLDQLAQRFERGGRFYEIEFRPVMDGADLALVLVVVRDITERVERERAQREQRDAVAVFRRILADRIGFDEFFAEGTMLVERISLDDDADPAEIVRAVHTLKGTAGIFEIESVAAFCHEIEQHMSERASGPSAAERAQLASLWSVVSGLRDQLTASSRGSRLEIAREEYEQALSQLEARGDTTEVASAMRRWVNERATTRLERVAGQLRSIAKRVGKPDVEIHANVSPADLRLPADRWAPFWTVIVHVLRNAVDHGIETSDERNRASKTGAGAISLSLVADEDGVALTIADDGRGIAWERIRARARELGLPATTAEELEEALFAESVSSRDVVTDISGRGVGMSAVRELVRACGGSIAIASAPGEGTSFRFLLPNSMLDTSASEPSHAKLRSAA